MKNRDCHVSKLGAKHLSLAAAQVGIPVECYPNTYNVTGQWYLINKPEHLRESAFVPFEVPNTLCPFCEGVLTQGEGFVMTPLNCPCCLRTGWIYDEYMDLHHNWDSYQAKAESSGITDKTRLWDELGIPSI